MSARARAALRRVPRAAWICMLVCVLNAAAWSLVTPAFQILDEQWHYAYVEHVAEHGRPPIPEPPRMSPSERVAFDDLAILAIAGNPRNGTISSAPEQRQLLADLARHPSRDGNGASISAEPEPPLYYLLEAVPFKLAAGGTTLDRLALMRLLSALLSGLTVLLTFLFLRETLPACPWTWTVGALGVAFQPLFASTSGGVNPDNLLFAMSAALFLVTARMLRRGITAPRAALVGAVMALGFLSKINFVGLLPGAVLGLLVAALRHERGLRLRTLRLPALALGAAAAPVAFEMALNVLAWSRPAMGSGVYSTADIHPSAAQALSYVWEFYLPALPGMLHPVATSFSTWNTWITGLIGRFGWFDTVFPTWVYDAAAVPLLAIVGLCVRTLAVHRRALRERRAELLVYAALAGGLLLLIAGSSYNLFLRRMGGAAEARYLLPLLPLYGGALVLAARGAGARRVGVVGAAIVVVLLAHDVFSLLLVISRYYG